MKTPFLYVLDDVAVITGLFWVSLAIVLMIILAPACRFYAFGWAIRKQEFTNRLLGKPIESYLARFWQDTITRRKLADTNKDDQFSAVYDIIAGRQLYLMPGLLLTLALLIFGGLAIITGLRAGYEQYVQFYMGIEAAEKPLFADPIHHLALLELNRAFYPFPSIALTFPTLASVAGAYLNVAQVVIRGYKDRTLLSSDLLWGAFRLVIAIPLGMAVGVLASASLAPLIGFALGGFPISELNKLLRRLASRALSDAESANRQDALLSMMGVTPDISAQLGEEGIYAPQQLIDTDPVSLAVRTGLPFDFVVNLIAQSQVWSFLGETATKLAPLGYGDARMIKRLMDGVAAQDANAVSALTALAQTLAMDKAMLTIVLKALAADAYTVFLFNI
jgi:hypothetical protein